MKPEGLHPAALTVLPAGSRQLETRRGQRRPDMFAEGPKVRVRRPGSLGRGGSSALTSDPEQGTEAAWEQGTQASSISLRCLLSWAQTWTQDTRTIVLRD